MKRGWKGRLDGLGEAAGMPSFPSAVVGAGLMPAP